MVTVREILAENYSPEFERRVLADFAARGKAFTSTSFFKLMQNRLVIGQYRYAHGARLNILNPELKNHDRDFLQRAMWKYQTFMAQGNLEFLVDIANYAMFEFISDPNGRCWDSGTPYASDTLVTIPWALRRYDITRDAALLVLIGQVTFSQFYFPDHPRAFYAASDQEDGDTGSLPAKHDIRGSRVKFWRRVLA